MIIFNFIMIGMVYGGAIEQLRQYFKSANGINDYSQTNDYSDEMKLMLSKMSLIRNYLFEDLLNPEKIAKLSPADYKNLEAQALAFYELLNPIRLRTINTEGTIFYNIVNFIDINNYGCWCRLALAGKGWGDAVDEIDSICKVFQHCRRCIIIEDETCEPASKKYNIGFIARDDIFGQCQMMNPMDTCAQRTCSCEVQFITDLMKVLFTKPMLHSSQYLLSEGFTPDAQCTVYVNGQTDWQCCGQWPVIMPYNTFDKQCCKNDVDDKIAPYDDQYQICCEDGSVLYHTNSCSNRLRRSIGGNKFDVKEYMSSMKFYYG